MIDLSFLITALQTYKYPAKFVGNDGKKRKKSNFAA